MKQIYQNIVALSSMALHTAVLSLFVLMLPDRLDVVHPAGDLRHRRTIQVVASEVSAVEILMQPKAAKP